MRILMITNQVKVYALGFRNVIEPMMELGHHVVWAANFSAFVEDTDQIPCDIEHIDIYSSPVKPKNYKAYKRLKQIVVEKQIEAIYCSTPIGGLLGRLLGRKFHHLKIIYAAHGFLFFKGAPLINQTLYKWEEQYLARYTDVLITINKEDYEASKNLKLRRGGNFYMIHGAGIETGKKVDVDQKLKREQLGVPANAFMIMSAGFLNTNKNNQIVIKAVAQLQNYNIVYVICGEGVKETELKQLSVRLGVSSKVLFLGYRQDVADIMAVSDCFVMPSYREGVPRALLEAMDLGVTCVGSRTRGITELIGENEGGFLCDPNDESTFTKAFETLILNRSTSLRMAERNSKEALKYSEKVVRTELYKILKEELN